MRDTSVPPVVPIRPTPSAQHRKQTVWQVWVPLAASILVVLVLAILAIVGAVQGSDQVERWGNISAVIVILPVLLFSLVTLAIVAGAAYGVTKLLQHMPAWMLSAQSLSIRIALLVRKASDAAVQPVIVSNTFNSRVKVLWNSVFQHKTPAA